MTCRRMLLAAAAFLSGISSATADEPLTFEKDIRPIFRAHCFDCHGAVDELSGGLDLRLVRLIQKGGDSGSALEAGDPGASYLLDRMRSGEMPPGEAKATAEEIATIERWIAQGAKTLRPEPEAISPGLGVTPEERDFWSFHPITRPVVPTWSPTDRVRTPVDAFLLTKLREADLSFADDANKHSLIHRSFFDLVGLAPSAEEVAEFIADDSPDAYEHLVERLLADPRYGERWARHWLDVAGYADSEGGTGDPERPYAYKYRDYVVRSLNADKPFDQFIVEQLAGDELVPPAEGDLSPERIEALIATGFLRMAPDGTASATPDAPLARNQVVGDTIKIVSTSLLGLSVGCAQCHDHRYDPIPQTDYFRMRAVFEPSLDPNAWKSVSQRQISLYTAADRAKAAELEAQAQVIAAEKGKKQEEYIAAALEEELKKHPEELREALREAVQTPDKDRSEEQKKLLAERPSVNIRPGVLYQYNQKAADDLKSDDARIAEIRAQKPVEEFVRALTEQPGHRPKTFLFHRGDHRQPKDEILPGDLTISAPEGESVEIPVDDPNLPTSGRRLAYARRLTNGEHPLVARVLVNRIWIHHFGRGIVGTPSDFGRLGERPTHPELLDWLADEFVRQGWSLKTMHRLIMHSTAYRQSSEQDSQRMAVDADGGLYSRMPLRRLDAEVVRDRMLAASGVLDERLFGSPVKVKADDAGRVTVDGKEDRRSLYLQVRRTQPLPVLTAFDAPVMEINCERRVSSTVATQALLLMNGDFSLHQAKTMAERVRDEAATEADVELETPLPVLPTAVWQFGYSPNDPAGESQVAFRPLPHWTGSTWQGGIALPDPALNWVLLNATGGHTGETFAAVRRWTAPSDGIVTVTGRLSHGSPNGDGVRGRLISSRDGQRGEWIAANGETQTVVDTISIQQGDWLDFVVDKRDSTNADSFGWPVQLELKETKDGQRATVHVWDSTKGFAGPAGPSATKQIVRAWKIAYGRTPSTIELQAAVRFLADQHALMPDGGDRELAAMTNLCQALLTSNEFLYAD